MIKFSSRRQRVVSRSRGFTIVELLIVIVVIAILAAIGIVAYKGINDRARASSLQSDLASAVKMLKLYQADYGVYPTSIDSTTYCPTPADTNYCLKASSGNAFANYSANNTTNPPSFSIDAIGSNGMQFYASDTTAPSSSNDSFTMAAISGTPRTGSVLTAGAFTPSGTTASRQWQRSTATTGPWTNIAGATASTYTLASGDMGYFVQLVATGTGSYSGSVTSAPTAKITTLLTGIATPTGTPTVGSTLTVGARTPSGATAGYQSRSNGVNIAGATNPTYVLTSAEVGTTITVFATGNNNYSGTATSPPTATVN